MNALDFSLIKWDSNRNRIQGLRCKIRGHLAHLLICQKISFIKGFSNFLKVKSTCRELQSWFLPSANPLGFWLCGADILENELHWMPVLKSSNQDSFRSEKRANLLKWCQCSRSWMNKEELILGDCSVLERWNLSLRQASITLGGSGAKCYDEDNRDIHVCWVYTRKMSTFSSSFTYLTRCLWDTYHPRKL